MKAEQKKTNSSVSTRERILDTALKLFNEKSESSVTTAQIAASSGIREGNLWYHFRTKREIVFELSCRLEAEIDKNLSRLPEDNSDFRDFLRYATSAFEYLWEYRFLFRDRFVNTNDENTLNRLQDLTTRGQQNLECILGDMRRREMLFLSPEEAHALTVNVWIIHSNWLRYLQMREDIREITESHIKEGFSQLRWLFNPYLGEDDKREAAAFISEFSLNRFNSELNEEE